MRSSTVARASCTISSTALFLGLVTAGLAGCAASPRAEDGAVKTDLAKEGVVERHQDGAGWGAVFLPEKTEQAVSDIPGGREWDFRNDRVLYERSPGVVMASGDWPDVSRPSLESYRTLSLPRQPENFIYFRYDSWR